MRLLDATVSSSSAANLDKVTTVIRGQQRSAITGNVPFTFVYDLHLPEDGYLQFGINRSGGGEDARPLDFSLVLSAGDEVQTVFEDTLPSSQDIWKDVRVHLGDFASQPVRLQFAVSADEESDATGGDRLAAYWSDLILVGNQTMNSREPPDVHVILIDTLRADHLGTYGYHRQTSPHIDALASEGVRFDRAISAAPWTDPSILALFTGLYPSDIWKAKPHIEAQRDAIPASAVTWAEILAASGYFTTAASDHPGVNARRFGQGFDLYSDLSRFDAEWRGWREAKTGEADVSSQLRDLLTYAPDIPLFNYVHLIYPHLPYGPPPEYEELFGPGTSERDEAKKDLLINSYDAEIRRADALVGQYVKDVHRLRPGRQPIFVVVSDHGEAFWDHGLFEHGNSLYNELLRVPLVISAPALIPGGLVVEDVVRTVDVLPTVLDLIGIQSSSHIRGRSALPTIRGEREPPRIAFSEFPHSRMIHGQAVQSLTSKQIRGGNTVGPFLGTLLTGGAQAVVTSGPTRLKAMRSGFGVESFSLLRDPAELQPLDSLEQPDLDLLMAELDAVANPLGKPYAAEQVQPTEDTLEKLRTLGYIR